MAYGEIYLKSSTTGSFFFRNSSNVEVALSGSNGGGLTPQISSVPTAVENGQLVLGWFFNGGGQARYPLAFRSGGTWYYLRTQHGTASGLPTGEVRVNGGSLEIYWNAGWRVLSSG